MRTVLWQFSFMQEQWHIGRASEGVNVMPMISNMPFELILHWLLTFLTHAGKRELRMAVVVIPYR